MRTLRQRRLITSITFFVVSILIITSILTSLVNNDMYMGNVETGEDYYYSSAPRELWYTNTSVFNINDNFSSSSTNEVTNTSDSTIQAINIAIIFKNVGSKNKSEKLLQDFQACAESMLKHAHQLPLHFVLLTDPSSIGQLNIVVRNLARVRSSVPITVDYVDLDAVTRNMSQIIGRLKRLFAPESNSSKYQHDLFHVGPLYHRILPPSTSRLLVMDADLRFHADVADLYQEFNQFSTELMALAPELSPLYFKPFANHRSKTGSSHGMYHAYPGLNSGVVLYHLNNMRQNARYNELLDVEGRLEELCALYGGYQGAQVGDQDLFTLLRAANPDWIKVLDCGWNVQLDQEMKAHPLFDLYHDCKSQIKLLHGNGGANIPEL